MIVLVAYFAAEYWGPLLAVWPFASGWMLLWLLAAGIPVLLHFWNRRKHRRTRWAAMEYLLAAVRKNARRIRLEQLFLLAVRVAILVLFALALADPLLSVSTPLTSLESARTHWLLVLDASYSMDYRSGGPSRFSLAKRIAANVVDRSAQGDGFTLLQLSDPPQVIIGEPTFDLQAATEEIHSLSLAHTGGDLSATLALVKSLLERGERYHPRLTEKRICFFTDMGRNTWEASLTSECRELAEKLSQKAELKVFDVTEDDEKQPSSGGANLAITTLQPNTAPVTADRPVRIDAEVANIASSNAVEGASQASTAKVLERTVEFFVDRVRVGESQVSLSPGGRAQASIRRVFSPGEHVVEARIAQDALPLDNHRWLSLPVRDSIEVLCVRGKLGAARQLAIALNPSVEPSLGKSPIRVTVRAENALLEDNLSKYDCVFLCNIGRFGPSETAILRDYLKGGGGLVFCLGDQVQTAAYNQLLAPPGPGEPRLLPVRLGAPVEMGDYVFDPLEYRHPIVAPFRGHENAGLLTSPIWKYIRLTPFPDSASKTALAFTNGDPAIVEEKILRGTVVVFATAVSLQSADESTGSASSWTAISAWHSFPPLMHEILAHVLRGRLETRNVQVGDVIEGEAAGASDLATVTAPDGQSERIRLIDDGSTMQFRFDNTNRSGVYTLQFDSAASAKGFAVNLDTGESDLSKFDPQSLPRAFRRSQGVDKQKPADEPQMDAPPRQSRLFRILLVGVLALLLLEPLLAWRLGRTQSGTGGLGSFSP